LDDRRRIETELRIVAATYRYERRRLGFEHAGVPRARARSMLLTLQPDAAGYPELAAAVANLIEAIDRDERLAAGGLGEQPVDGGGQLVDVERLD
jgi:hypothetical protein